MAFYSGNMIGKDFLVGRLIWWWLYTRPDSLVIVTGPSQTLLGLVTWKRCDVRHHDLHPRDVARESERARSRLIAATDRQALGFSTTSIERASGQHNANLLVIVDEASGVDDEIWDAIESLGYQRLVAIGNPILLDGRFISLIRQADQDARDGIPPRLGTNAIQIPSTDSPHADLEKSPGESPIEPGSTPVIAGTDVTHYGLEVISRPRSPWSPQTNWSQTHGSTLRPRRLDPSSLSIIRYTAPDDSLSISVKVSDGIHRACSCETTAHSKSCSDPRSGSPKRPA